MDDQLHYELWKRQAAAIKEEENTWGPLNTLETCLDMAVFFSILCDVANVPETNSITHLRSGARRRSEAGALISTI
jgi:hypothetical protein